MPTEYQVHHTPDGVGRCWPEEEGSRCPQYDGSRCGIQGQRPSIGNTCPVWAADLVQAARGVLRDGPAVLLQPLLYADPTPSTEKCEDFGSCWQAPGSPCRAAGRCLKRHPLADWEK